MKVYLAGPIDRAPDLGATWRQHVKQELEGAPIELLDPLGKEGLANYREALADAQNNSDFERMRELVSNVVKYDLEMVEDSDFIICNIDTSVHACGTYDEIGLAAELKIPVLFFSASHIPINKWPAWLFGRHDYKLFFNSLEELINYIGENEKFLSNTELSWSCN